MRRMMERAVLVFAGVLAFTLVPSALGYGNGCYSNNLQGTFGFTLTGTRNTTGADPGPRAAVGPFPVDRSGHLTGSEPQRNHGTLVTGVTAPGTVTINADCSGSA